MSDVQQMARTERQSIYDFLSDLTDEQWNLDTACSPWTVRHLAAHMTALGNQNPFNFVKGMVRNGFSFDKFVDRDLRRFNEGSNADVLARFGATLGKQKPPPGPKYVSLGEYLVHGEDIRRACGVKGNHPESHIAALVPMYAKTGDPIGGKARVAGLRLVPTDGSWSYGDGPEVTGSGTDLVLAITGRASGLEGLSGEGVDTLRARC